MATLELARDVFRRKVFARDHGLCVVCSAPAVDAHHIIERRLWEDGGYHVDNGVSVCELHHKEAEATLISCDELRRRAGINSVMLPPHLDASLTYDKWGNPMLPNGRRLIGELFHDESVYRVLTPVRHLFTEYVKYPRTYHLPWSPGGQDHDERSMSEGDVERLIAKPVVVTEKMDGECTTMYRDRIHARSLDTVDHPSRHRVKALHGVIQYDIPPGFRISGENVYAQHSVAYTDLEDYFLVFSIWDRNRCLSWQETKEWCALLALKTVPVLFEGRVQSGAELAERSASWPVREGYVVRSAGEFLLRRFRYEAGKYVRAGHVQTDEHWLRRPVVPNRLREAE